MECSPKPREKSPKENLFDILRDLNMLGVFSLQQDYLTLFPNTNNDSDEPCNGALPLKNVNELTFEPDRLIHMCKAVQNAIREVAKITDGDINVVEAGMGLGYVALAALALNDEFQNRIKVLGLEINPDTLKRVRMLFEYYGIPKDQYKIYEADATKFSSIPENTHILVAEHISPGLFSKEPLFDVHANLVPKLAYPYYIVPEGVDVYGRVISTENRIEDNKLPPEVIQEIISYARKKFGELAPILTIKERDLERFLPQDRIIMAAQHLFNIRFADIMNGGWEDEVHTQFHGTAEQNGEGVLELKSAPVFPPVLYDRRYHLLTDEGFYFMGTKLNAWMQVANTDGLMDLLYLQAVSRFQGNYDDALIAEIADNISNRLHTDPGVSQSIFFQRGKKYKVSIDGRVSEVSANIQITERN